MATGTIEKVVPTSSAEDSNGYCKMPDGTLICWGTITKNVSSWGRWPSGSTTPYLYQKQIDISDHSYPVAFYYYPQLTVNIAGSNWALIASCSTTKTGVSQIAIVRPNEYTGDFMFRYIAVGRWKA